MAAPVVIKVGGSLLDWPGLPARLAEVLAGQTRRVVLIVGGGRAVDWVRDLDRWHGLGEERAHALALRALDLTAHLLAALVPGLEVVPGIDALGDGSQAIGARAPLTPTLSPEGRGCFFCPPLPSGERVGVRGSTRPEDLDSIGAVWGSGRIPILLPRIILDEEDRLAQDPLPHSWAVTSDSIAARVAVRLGAEELLLLKSAPLPPGIDRTGAARLGLVDPAFTAVARPLGRVLYLNLRDPPVSAQPL
jgi:aspartokinase-like uncharacterized kinase